MVLEKKRLSLDEIEAQTALELPDREMMLITVVITNVLNNLSIDVDVRNINVGVQICAVVNAITTNLLTADSLTCRVVQR
jgi:hypothetical protein